MVLLRKKKKPASSSGGFSMPSVSSSSTDTALSGSTGTNLSGSTALKGSASTGVKAPLAKQLAAEPTSRTGGGGFRGTFFQANRPKSTGTRPTTRSRTPSGRTFDAAAKARIAAAQASRGGAGASSDVFEILIKTYSEVRRDELADAFLDIVIEECPVGETGVLVDSAHVEETFETATTMSARVVVDAPYAEFVNDGSDAVVDKLMVWEGDDGTVFATSRAAIPANPFWDRALSRWSEAVATVDANR